MNSDGRRTKTPRGRKAKPQVPPSASTAVGLGDVDVALAVTVKPTEEVDCVLTFRGNSVTVVFAGEKVRAIHIPEDDHPTIIRN